MGDKDAIQGHSRMVRRHIERPLVARNLDPFGVGWDKERCYTARRSRFTARPREDDHMRTVVRPRLPFLGPVDLPSFHTVTVALALGNGRHERRVATVIGFGEAECRSEFTAQSGGYQCAFLFLGPEMVQHEQVGKIADYAVLILQVVCEAQAASVDRVRGQMEANCGHIKVCTGVRCPAVDLGEGEAVESSGVSEDAGFV